MTGLRFKDTNNKQCSPGICSEKRIVSAVSAIILGGGSGVRMGGELPKQFMLLAGKPVLMHTIEKFSHFNAAINIIVVLPKNQIEDWKAMCAEHKFAIPHCIAPGGKERFHSVQNGLNHVTNDGIVFIHDGVRPFVSAETIQRCYQTALRKGNALPVVPVSDSVRFGNEYSNKPIDREQVFLVQTPQTFNASMIKEAYRQPYDSNFSDDATVFENAGHTIFLVEGNRENIKLTWPSDLLWANTFFGG